MARKLGTAVFASIALFLIATVATTRAADVPASAPAAVPAPAKLRVQVLGRVKYPGNLQLDAGARLSDALTAAGADFERLIARVGGAPVPDTECALGGPSLRNVYLTRTTEASKQVSYAIDVSIARQIHDLRYDPLLQDNDKIFVPDCRRNPKVILPPPTFPVPTFPTSSDG